VPGDRLGGVGHPVADHAHDLEKGFARDADVDVVLDRLHRLEVALGGPALVGARTREPEGHYRVRDELLVQACPLRELGERVALLAGQGQLDRQEHQAVLLHRPAQRVHREALVEQLPQ
jgi:hypothetical protein